MDKRLTNTKKLYIIAGETSGDIHGGNMIKELLKLEPNIDIRAWGGERMTEAGAHVVKHYAELAFMGFSEVIMNIRTILRNLKTCKEDIAQFKPDAIVLIDYPGFNFRIAEWAAKQNIKVIYYISPQLWAWKKGRIKKVEAYVDRMITILPFEKPFYADNGLDVDYVGHPLLDEIQLGKIDQIKDHLAIIPGSRKQEIKRMLPLMLDVAAAFDYPVAVAKAPSIPLEYYYAIAQTKNLKFDDMRSLLQKSKLAMVSSGTATLETALYDVPQVVCYKAGAISYRIAKMLVKLKYISLPNLIMDAPIITELIQADFNKKSLFQSLKDCDQNSDKIKNHYKELKKNLGSGLASRKTAELVLLDLNFS